MKKLLKNFTIFLVLLFFLDYSIGSFLQYLYFHQTSGLYYRTTYSMDSTDADVLIFGSSRANHHYVPEIFEDSLDLTYYNTGRDGNGIFNQLAILRAIKNRYKPQIIILDYYNIFPKNETEYDKLSNLLPYYSRTQGIDDLIWKKSPFEKIKSISKVYRYNSMFLTIIVGNMEFNKKRKPDIKGYIPLKGRMNTKLSKKLQKHPAYDKNKIQSFNEFLNLSKEITNKVFVVYSPIYNFNIDSNEIDKLILSCEDKGVYFIDFSKDTSFLNNSFLFRDFNHLNHSGAIKFSNLLVDTIQSNNIN